MAGSDEEDKGAAASQPNAQAEAGARPYRASAKMPGPIDIEGEDRKVNWELHKQMWTNYSIATRLEREEPRIQRAEFLNSLGRETLRIVNHRGRRYSPDHHKNRQLLHWQV